MDTQIVKDLIREFKAAELTKLSLKYEGLEISLEREDRRIQELNHLQTVGNASAGNIASTNVTGNVNGLNVNSTGLVGNVSGINNGSEVTGNLNGVNLAGANILSNGQVSGNAVATGANGVNSGDSNINIKHITSPMVGTFYASSTPSGAPFVTVGTKVKKGDCVCIIEAMKLMNEIEADADGEILEVLVKNEEMVEFGQPLFVIG